MGKSFQKVLQEAKGRSQEWIMDLQYRYSNIGGNFISDIGGEFAQIQTPWT